MHTAEQRAAYVNSQAACALIEALGMVADNLHRQSLGETIAHDGEAFSKLIERYGIHHNGVLGLLNPDLTNGRN